MLRSPVGKLTCLWAFHSLHHANSMQQRAGGEDARELSHIVSGGKALWVACPHLISCADASVYDTAVNLFR